MAGSSLIPSFLLGFIVTALFPGFLDVEKKITLLYLWADLYCTVQLRSDDDDDDEALSLNNCDAKST